MPNAVRRMLRKDSEAPQTPSVETEASSWFEARRPHIAPVGLPRDFLHDVAHLADVHPRLKPLLDDPAVIAAIERDETPIPATQDREGYFDVRHLSYWLSGLDDFRMVQSMVPASSLKRVLDFGGATGRFARHVSLADEAATVTIAELSLDHVMWCDRHFGRSVRAVKIKPWGHLPLADGSVGTCVGLSVFTHIDASESAWLAELHRVLESGGHALLTIHSEHTWNVLPQRPEVMAALSEDPRFVALYQPAAPMPEERMVFDYKPGTIYHCCNTFVSSEYVRRCWGRWFDVLEIRPNAHHGFQTAVLLRKRD